MIQKARAVAKRMHALLLRRRLWRGSKQIGNLFDAFCEVELRLLAQAIAVGVGPVEELGFDVEEGVVSLVLRCASR
jgi:hypothetical protein